MKCWMVSKTKFGFLKNEKLVVDGRLSAVEMEVGTLKERLAAIEKNLAMS